MQSLRIQLVFAIPYLHLARLWTWSNYKCEARALCNDRIVRSKVVEVREEKKKTANWHNWNRQEEFSRVALPCFVVRLHFWDYSGCCTRVNDCGSSAVLCNMTDWDTFWALKDVVKIYAGRLIIGSINKKGDWLRLPACFQNGENLSQRLKVTLLIIEKCRAQPQL